MWDAFRGSPEALKYAQRDLDSLRKVIDLTPGRSVAVQAGGSLGIWPKWLAQYFATVYTFEPAADAFAMLMHNAPEPNIVKFQAVLGETHRLVGLSRERRDGKPNIHEGITYVSGSGNIPTLRIDDFEFPDCDLIYLDTEGTELEAIRGGQDTIRRCRPVLAVEINKNLGFVGRAEDEVRSFIVWLGYRFVCRLRSDEVYVPAEWAAAA